MKISHKDLIDLLQKAYSAEKAAGFANQGHAGSLKDKEQKKSVRQIEWMNGIIAGKFFRS